MAKEYPKTIFVTTSGSRTGPNLAPIVFELEQAAYLCGLGLGSNDEVRQGGHGRRRGASVDQVHVPRVRGRFGGGTSGWNRAVRLHGLVRGRRGREGGRPRTRGSGVRLPLPERGRSGARRPQGRRRALDLGVRHEQGPERSLAGRPRLGRHRHAARLRRDRAPREGREVRRPTAALRPFERRDLVRLEPGCAPQSVPASVVEEAKTAGEKIKAGTLAVPRGNF